MAGIESEMIKEGRCGGVYFCKECVAETRELASRGGDAALHRCLDRD